MYPINLFVTTERTVEQIFLGVTFPGLLTSQDMKFLSVTVIKYFAVLNFTNFRC